MVREKAQTNDRGNHDISHDSSQAAAQAKLRSDAQSDKPSKRERDEARALVAGGATCDSNWSHMVGQWVTHNEGGEKFLTYNANDMGQGISVGLLQWNQKKGRLPELLQAWHSKDAAKFDRLFGSYAPQMLKADAVRKADFNGNEVLHRAMLAALADKEFQQVQTRLRNNHIVHSCQVAQAHDFKSLRGRAVVADLYNQIGENGTVRALSRVPRGRPESERIELLKVSTGNRINGHDRVASIEDRVKEIWRKIGAK